MWEKSQSEKFTTPDYSNEYFRKPLISELLGDIRGKKLLEIGCGSGYWMRFFAEKGAHCCGLDINNNQLRIALKQEAHSPLGIQYFLGDAADMSMFASDSQDIVFIEFVLLEIQKRSVLNNIFLECFRVLKENGVLFVSEMHPFDPFFDERYELPEGFTYYSSGGKFTAKARQLDGSTITFDDYHWTFEDYCEAITGAGFFI